MITATAISHYAKLHSRYGLSVVGKIQPGLPSPTAPTLNHMSELIVPAMVIAAVSFSISISLAKMFSRKHGYKVSSNQVC